MAVTLCPQPCLQTCSTLAANENNDKSLKIWYNSCLYGPMKPLPTLSFSDRQYWKLGFSNSFSKIKINCLSYVSRRLRLPPTEDERCSGVSAFPPGDGIVDLYYVCSVFHCQCPVSLAAQNRWVLNSDPPCLYRGAEVCVAEQLNVAWIQT